MDRDDQLMVDFYHRCAKIAAKYNMFLDMHGGFKPSGLSRTYPNVLNYEGVYGLENMKWYKGQDMVTYDVQIPFIRMAAGPMDYTQGAMLNGGLKCTSTNAEPKSQGTRCRQMGMYVVFESPFNMLCDTPIHYEAEMECTEFIASVPTVWDETVALDGKVGEYVVIARRKGLPTIIVDEIDTGVSGRIADAMGEIISSLGENMQVVAITHLPQVASKGESHFVVYKENSRTNISALDSEQRVMEIAKMLSGSEITDAALMQAKLLLEKK